MNLLFQKYTKLNCWYLYLINIVIYIVTVFVHYRFVETDKYYEQYMKPLFHSEDDYIAAVTNSRFFELYNYLWVPLHVGIMILFISMCIYIGYNVLNYAIELKSCIKVTSQSIIIFSLNGLFITSLKACGIIAYNVDTISDDYFLQSLGRLLIHQKYPDIIYSFLEKVNMIEISFCFILSFLVARTLLIKFKHSLTLTSGIYLCGTVIYICFLEFSYFLFTN